MSCREMGPFYSNFRFHCYIGKILVKTSVIARSSLTKSSCSMKLIYWQTLTVSVKTGFTVSQNFRPSLKSCLGFCSSHV